MTGDAPTVFVVDDDISVRHALASLIESAGLHVTCFASAGEFRGRRLPESPACLVLDVRMPEVSGLDLQRELAKDGQVLPIIFITAHAEVSTAVEAMKAGAIEFLSKPFSERDLLEAISRALESDRAAKAQRAQHARTRERRSHLTPRERQVLERMVRGRLTKQIAAELGLSETTVKVHRRHIMQKMAAKTFAELVLMVERTR